MARAQGKRVVQALGMALWLWVLGCGIKGPPRPAVTPVVNSSAFQPENPGREFPSRSPIPESGVPPSLQPPPPPPPPIPDGGIHPFVP